MTVTPGSSRSSWAAAGAEERGPYPWRAALNGEGTAAVVIAALVAAALMLAGCASMPISDPVTSFDQVAGQWQGLISFPGRFDQFIYLTIDDDGRLFAAWGSTQSWGQVTLSGGRARFQMRPPPFEGDLQLFAGNGRRSLVMREVWGSFVANLTPQRTSAGAAPR